MPEGFNSVADLVVAIKADTKGLQSGLASVTDLMKSFDGLTGGSLKSLVEFGEKGQISIGGMVGRLTEVGGKITKIGEVIERAAEVAKLVASAAGGDDEMAQLTAEASSLQLTLLGLAEVGLDKVAEEAKQAAASLGLYSASAGEAGESSENFVERSLLRLKDVLRDVKLDLANLLPAGTLDIDTEGQLLDRTIAKLDELKRRAAEADEVMARIGDARGAAVSDPNGDLERQIKGLEMQAWVLSQFAAIERMPWTATIDTSRQDQYLARLADEVVLLEKRASLIGVAASVSASELARERLRIDADRAGVGFTAEQTAAMDDQFRRMSAAQARIDAAAEAKRSADLAERQNAGADRTIEGLARSIEAERQRRREVGATVGEVAALRAEEQALAQIRALGREATDDERIAIRAAAIEKGREVEATERLRDAQERLQDSAAVLGRSMESAFRGWIMGAKTDWSDLVGMMLADLAILSLRQNVLMPLFGGGGTGSGLFGDAMQSIFGGFREGGGPVEAGRAYIVGEKRPELFIPNVSGRIEPSIDGALGGRSVQVITNIDARGATVDAIQELKSAMAARDAALPNQVLAVVREGRDRGVT